MFYLNFISIYYYSQMCIVVTCDCFTGVFAGFAVFSTIGFLAKALNESIDNYAKAAGPGLAFITYPEAVSNMPASPFFSIIFFAMLLALGLGSQVQKFFCLTFNDNPDFSFLVRVDQCTNQCTYRSFS